MKTVYLDHMANNPVDPRVVEAIIPHIKETYGNPLNIHDAGRKTLGVIEGARGQVAKLINAQKTKEIIFTSCGSESNNLAIKGIAKAYENKGKHVITTSIEHFSVHYPLKDLEKDGFKVTYLPVDNHGMVDPKKVAEAITKETILVSIIHSSNEIGTIEPIAEISKVVKEKGIIFHVDGIQTIGNIPIDVSELGADALSFSANQFYGPSGIAALYLKTGTRIIPFIKGGTQEEGRRAGSYNVVGIVGMGKAAELAKAEMQERIDKLVPLRDKLTKLLQEKIDGFVFTGHQTERLPNHVSGCVKYIEGESISMFLNMEGISISTGSACVSKALKASHVLIAIGVDRVDINGSVVFSLGKDTKEEDIDYLMEKLPGIVDRLRQMSPLYKKG